MKSPPAEGLAAWLRLALAKGVGAQAQRKLLATFDLPESIWHVGKSALRSVVGENPAASLLMPDDTVLAQVDAALQWASLPGNHILTLADADYPQALLRTDDPPILLYAKGRIELLNRPSLAIVGSRNATPQGLSNAEAFASTFSKAGLTVVSGLALGIDTSAHRGALPAKEGDRQSGSTIAVIGTGADRIYPARNQSLAHRLAQDGLILSEFALGTPAINGNFPRRNRLIAGLSLGCLVVEAAARSGSLITARLATEAGREVFAIPGSIHSPLAKGCHQLIKQGAKLVESAQDVLEELRFEPAQCATSAASAALSPAPVSVSTGEDISQADSENERLLASLGHDPCTLDILVARCGLTAQAVLAILLQLELEGRVASLPGGRYQRLV